MASTTMVWTVDGCHDAFVAAEQRVRQLEHSWSRFIDTSDISRVNQHPDTWVPVAADTIRLIDTMKLASRATGGRYDPTRLHELLAIGYTTSIDDPMRFTMLLDGPTSGATIEDVVVDHVDSAVLLPAGLALDPGGIGKGLAADIVVTELLAAGTAGALVSIGGDIAAAGTSPTDCGWPVTVDDPWDPGRPCTTLAVSAGGIATSSTRSRRWITDGREHHHVIDPATGHDAGTDLAAATVIANAGWLAEAHATAALLCGSHGVIDYLDRHDLAGVAVTDQRVLVATDGLDLAHPIALGTEDFR
jgi:thiamine biosynthesis lipoprotein